jgi:tRNA A37 threonylcarbamoyladenosine dehydratase
MGTLHRFTRTELLIGSDGLAKLKNSSVAIFGVGGVGSFAAEALCRAGVGRITIIDFDDVCQTNINRQIHAMDGTVGRPKVQVMAERMRLINPDAEIIPYHESYSAETSPLLLADSYDYVVDAIDNITAKIHLINSCKERGIPIISSMGAAAKTDPSRIKVADISATHACRMARAVRKLLRQRGVTKGVTVVFSTEEHDDAHQVISSCRPDCSCPDRDRPDFPCRHRKVILGSISFIPSIFGLTMAGVIINTLLENK